MTRQYSFTRSEYTERLINLKGAPFTFTNHPFMRLPYDTPSKETLLKAGRQVAKSTAICNVLITEMVGIPYFQTFYVSPTVLQTRRFSGQRFSPTIKDSPLLKAYFANSKTIQNVFEKAFSNGSCINFGNAFMSADSARGISADRFCADEVQDIMWDAMPVLKETLAASSYKWVLYAGTPKTFDNTIEKLWINSTQCEWIIRCTCCRKENIPCMENISQRGFRCSNSKCGTVLNVRTGRWMRLNPYQKREAYHVPQIIRPDLDWEELWSKITLQEYTEARIANEIMGESFDSGQKPVTLKDLMACSGDYPPVLKKSADLGIDHMYGGLDWAVTAGTSVFTVGGVDKNNKFKIIFSKKYTAADPLHVIADVAKHAHNFNIELIGADIGAGHTNNMLLRRDLPHTKLVEFQYVPKLLSGAKWDAPANRYTLDRTSLIDTTIHQIKTRYVTFPLYEKFGLEFFPDILCVFTEYNDYLKKIEYKHNEETADDFLHSLTYVLLAHKVHIGLKLI